jgi:lipoprotein-anchoring transpeptidase ErfK/SrfK
MEAGGRNGKSGPRASVDGGRHRRPLVLVAAAITALVAAPVPATARAGRSGPEGVAAQRQPLIAPSQLLARFIVRHPARGTPGPEGRLVAIVAAKRPLTGEPTVLPVIARAQGSDGQPWLEVRLPGRPLHGQVLAETGWIAAKGTVPRQTSWHVVVNRESRRASIFFRGRQIRRFSVIVGKPSTPTPVGDYFVEENVLMPPHAAGAPYALATSARSAVLQEFEGGPGQIALHGLRNLGGTLGTAVSHGCIRFANAAITWLASRVPPGAPITVV